MPRYQGEVKDPIVMKLMDKTSGFVIDEGKSTYTVDQTSSFEDV